MSQHSNFPHSTLTPITMEIARPEGDHLHNKQQPPFSNLPVELWCLILYIAGTPSSPSISYITRQPSFPLTCPTAGDGGQFFRLHVKATRVRKALQLVCRSWRNIAREWLFESVELRSRRVLQAFLRILEASASAAQGQGIGQRVKHLLLFTLKFEQRETLPSLLFHFPNLQSVWIVGQDYDQGHYILEALLTPYSNLHSQPPSSSTPSLTNLASFELSHSVSPGPLTLFLRSTQNLRSLSLGIITRPSPGFEDLAGAPERNISLPYLHTLRLVCGARIRDLSSSMKWICDHWGVPSLNALQVTGPAMYAPLLARFLPQLESLTLSNVHGGFTEIPREQSDQSVGISWKLRGWRKTAIFDYDLATATHLKELALDMHVPFSNLMHNSFTFPRLHTTILRDPFLTTRIPSPTKVCSLTGTNLRLPKTSGEKKGGRAITPRANITPSTPFRIISPRIFDHFLNEETFPSLRTIRLVDIDSANRSQTAWDLGFGRVLGDWWDATRASFEGLGVGGRVEDVNGWELPRQSTWMRGPLARVTLLAHGEAYPDKNAPSLEWEENHHHHDLIGGSVV